MLKWDLFNQNLQQMAPISIYQIAVSEFEILRTVYGFAPCVFFCFLFDERYHNLHAAMNEYDVDVNLVCAMHFIIQLKSCSVFIQNKC